MLTVTPRVLVAVIALVSTDCGSSTTPAVRTDSGTTSTCAWPTYLDPDSGLSGPESGLCVAHRYFFACADSSGGGGYCVSDSPDGGGPACAELSPGLACTAGCNADEYVVSCNSFSATAPNSSCRQVKDNPEQAYFCCGCVSAAP
jgi:hypothetical protein